MSVSLWMHWPTSKNSQAARLAAPSYHPAISGRWAGRDLPILQTLRIHMGQLNCSRQTDYALITCSIGKISLPPPLSSLSYSLSFSVSLALSLQYLTLSLLLPLSLAIFSASKALCVSNYPLSSAVCLLSVHCVYRMFQNGNALSTVHSPFVVYEY